MPSDVPGVRRELSAALAYADERGDDVIMVSRSRAETWLRRLHRDPRHHEPRPNSARMSMARADEARRLSQMGWANDRIARALNVSPGRISEVLNGLKWTR